MDHLPRHLAPVLRHAIGTNPVVFLGGPRQCGKSTLAAEVATSIGAHRYVTLDDLDTRAFARRDPVGFVAQAPDGLLVIDEVQRAPDLALAIKSHVDRDRIAGRFLLTGSASLHVGPELADALIGRMRTLRLWPFAVREALQQQSPNPIDALLAGTPTALLDSDPHHSIEKLMVIGGYPLAWAAASDDDRRFWFDDYIGTMLLREVRELALIERVDDLPQLVSLIATRTAGPANIASIARDIRMPERTVKRYLALLEAMHLVVRLPAWFTNIGKRLVKAPKLHITDSGLLAHLTGVTGERARAHRGAALENLVAMELVKHAAWSSEPVRFLHFRTHSGSEVDLVIEQRDGSIVGIEVKNGSTISSSDLRGLETLQSMAGDRFLHGFIYYRGNEIRPVGRNLTAIPISTPSAHL